MVQIKLKENKLNTYTHGVILLLSNGYNTLIKKKILKSIFKSNTKTLIKMQ